MQTSLFYKPFRPLILILVTLFCLANTGHSQIAIKIFSSDSIKYFKEVETLLTTARKADGKAFIKEFEPIWYGGLFTPQERATVYRTSNEMLKKRMQPFPDFINYLNSLKAFKATDQPEESFDAWNNSLDALLGGKSKRNFSKYLKFCDELFSNNTILNSGALRWASSNNFYEFQVENKLPKIVFPSLDLICYAKGDSAVIYETEGYYYPLEGDWYGKGGLVTWERAGFSRDSIWAELNNYQIETRKPIYEADSVIFHNLYYFGDKSLMGTLKERVLANVQPKRASFPSFQSYDARLSIKDLQPGVDYSGGFTQAGARFKGSGTEEQDALLIFNKDDSAFIVMNARSFTIRPERISSNEAGVSIYLGEDSITHPKVEFKFFTEDRFITMLRTKEGLKRSPYTNSYHNLDMYFEVMNWKLGEPTVYMGPLTGSSDKKAFFESEEFFREGFYDRIQGMDAIHPLIPLRNCAAKIDLPILDIRDLAQCMKQSESTTKTMMTRLAQMGYINYNFNKGEVRLKDKVQNHISAKAEKADYNIIVFNSNVKTDRNARINLLNNDLIIEGVRQIGMSDSHSVFIMPDSGRVIIKENMDFKFSGDVVAGKLKFQGKDFSFFYEQFKIDMPEVDTMQMVVEVGEPDEYGRRKVKKVQTVIEDMTAELLIDKPDNMSGLQEEEDYPILRSTEDSYAYYSENRVLGGAYDPNEFNFKLDPFELKSIDDFENEELQFDGTFSSGGIIPDITETLTLQDDYSLGFKNEAPAEGYPLYGGKAKMMNEVSLSNQGLRGDGTIQYLTATAESYGFEFYPDSVEGILHNLVIEEKMSDPQYPPVVGKVVDMHWEPEGDIMHVSTKNQNIQMYDGSELTGYIDYEPSGMRGGGLFAFEQAELESKDFDFQFAEFFADTADFRLKSADAEQSLTGLDFATENFKAHIDFTERKGDFESNGEGSLVDFPDNQYIAYMDKFTWYMDDQSIELSAKTKAKSGASALEFEGAKFISTNPDQDSLFFYSKAAKFDVAKKVITANQVEFILVADAVIYPEGEQLIIDRQAKMRTLEKAKITANSITKYHQMYDGTLNIRARKKYSGSAYYDYVDESQAKQQIFFTTVSVDSVAQTYATGSIADEASFKLNPYFAYKGEVELNASDQFLTFSGFSQISHECQTISRPWFSFTGEIDPEEIFIPIDSNTKDESNNLLTASVNMKYDSNYVYSTFLNPLLGRKDIPIARGTGFLTYDKGAKEYKIAQLDKLTEFSLPGPYASLNNDNCVNYSEGTMDLGVNLGQIKINTVGKVQHNLPKDEVELNTLMVLEFFFIDKLLQDIAELIAEDPELDPVDFESPTFEKGIKELLGKEDADKAISQLSLYGKFKKFPDELNKSMFLNRVKLKWNPETESYMSIGDIGVGNMFKKEANRMVPGYLEIAKRRAGDSWSLYIEPKSGTWYYFTYQRGSMQVLSSSEEFNAEITGKKPDDRKLKVERGQTPYSYMLGSKRKKTEFIRRFND